MRNRLLVSLQIVTEHMRLEAIAKMLGVRPSVGSHDKGEEIPKWMQPIEKKQKYESTRLTVSSGVSPWAGACAHFKSLFKRIAPADLEDKRNRMSKGCQIILSIGVFARGWCAEVPIDSHTINICRRIGARIRFSAYLDEQAATETRSASERLQVYRTNSGKTKLRRVKARY
jgi:hypothetical protein